MGNEPAVKIKLETLRSLDQSDTIDIDSHMSSHSMGSHSEEEQGMHTMMITPELMGLIPTSSSHSGNYYIYLFYRYFSLSHANMEYIYDSFNFSQI